jgi:hypothetical protein
MIELERGYSDTGYILEEGENIFKSESMEMEKHERKMMKAFGCGNEEHDVGGFLERQNTHDRM